MTLFGGTFSANDARAQEPVAEASSVVEKLKADVAWRREELLRHDSDAGIGNSIRRTRQRAREKAASGETTSSQEQTQADRIAELQQLRSIYLLSLTSNGRFRSGIYRWEVPSLWCPPKTNFNRFSVGVETRDGLWRP